MGSLKYHLEIEVARSKKGTFISQQKYMQDLLKETSTLRCKLLIPQSNHKSGEKNEEPRVEQGIYQRMLGKLIYLSHTRPNIANIASVVSQFMHSLLKSHIEAMYRIVRYLKRT